MDYRIEKDSLGEVRVPLRAYWGVQTQRAVENFPISGMRAHPKLVWATAAVKRAAAEANRDMGKLDPAIEHFRRVQQLQPTNTDAAIWLALLLHQKGEEKEAKQHYLKVIDIQPDNAVALNNLAFVIAEQGGDYDMALTYAQRAKQKVPQSDEISDTLAWIYFKKKMTKEALNIYDSLVAKQPKNPTFHYHRGLTLLQQGDKIQAKKELQTALLNKPIQLEQQKINEALAKTN